MIGKLEHALSQTKLKKIILFVLVCSLAIHTLYFISVYGVNVLFWDDWDVIPFVADFHNGTAWWNNPDFLQHNEHRAPMPYLILLLDIVVGDSWNSVHLLYFGWAMIAISVLLIYKMLKDFDPRLTWLLPLIAAILFSTSQYETLLWGLAATNWYLLVAGFYASVYFLNKLRDSSSLFILPALASSVITTFTLFQGLLIWPMGLIMILVSSKSMRIRMIWIASAAIIISLYFIHYNFAPQNGSHFLSINHDFVRFFLLFLSNGLVQNNESIQISIAIGLLVLFFPILLYLKIRGVKNNVVPWILFGLLGLSIDFLASSARAGVFSPLSPRYISLSNFFLISLLVIVTTAFLQYYNSSTTQRKKRIALVVFIIFIGGVIFATGTVYISGWKGGEAFHNALLQGKNCITDPGYNFNCPSIYPFSLQTNAAILKKLNLGPFAEANNSTITYDPLLNGTNWKRMNLVAGPGYIDYINGELTNSNPIIVASKTSEFIPISGWGLLDDKYNGDSAYVFVDDNLNEKIESGIERADIPVALGKQASLYSEYKGFIDSHDLNVGCHDVSVRVVKGDTYFAVTTSSKLCIQ